MQLTYVLHNILCAIKGENNIVKYYSFKWLFIEQFYLTNFYLPQKYKKICQ